MYLGSWLIFANTAQLDIPTKRDSSGHYSASKGWYRGRRRRSVLKVVPLGDGYSGQNIVYTQSFSMLKVN